MKNLGKWMLGAAIVAGGLGLGTTTAQAAQFRVYVGGSAYVPPCPGPGYVWAAGYYDGGYWVPGRWNYVGMSFVGGRNRFYDHDRGFYGRDRDDHQRFDRDDHRRNDRDDHRDRDRDHDRNRH